MADAARSYVLVLLPNSGAGMSAFPAVVGGYPSHADAKHAGQAAMRWPPNLTDEDYAAYHAAEAAKGQSSGRPSGQPCAWADYTVIPGAATTAPARETLRLRGSRETATDVV